LEESPLNSNEQSKIIIFIVLLLPGLVFLVGIIPILFLIFGMYMMKKDSNFIHIETAVRNFRIYAYIPLIIGAVSTLYFGIMCLGPEKTNIYGMKTSYEDDFLVSLAIYSISSIYIVLLNFLFYTPLSNHKKWVELKGVFATEKTKTNTPPDSNVNIIKGDNIRSYSVADELLKWAKLKEEGHISQEEFDQARKKLLKNN